MTVRTFFDRATKSYGVIEEVESGAELSSGHPNVEEALLAAVEEARTRLNEVHFKLSELPLPATWPYRGSRP